MMTRLLFGISALAIGCGAIATPLNPQQRLSAACIRAFHVSNPADADASGQKICACVGPESRHQGASTAAILKEAGAIEADPKHEFADRHVRDAFRYCIMTALDQD